MTPPVRRLGFGELRMHLMHTMLAGTTQGALSIRVAGELSMELLRQAVELVRQAHRMLALVIREEAGEFYFYDQAPQTTALVELRAAASEMGDGIAQLQAENAIPLDAANYTWRIAVIPYQGESPVHDIILVMHHAIMDAGGSDYLLDKVFTHMTGSVPEQLSTPALEPVPPSAESVCLVATGWDEFAATQQAVMRRTQAVNPPAHRQAAPHSERHTIGQAFKLARDEIAAISALCAGAGVSFNSWVSAALVASVQACDPTRDSLALYTAVSLRRLCPGAGDTRFGCYLSVVPTFHQLNGEAAKLVPLAREHQSALQAAFLEYGKPPRDYATASLQAGMQGLARIGNFVNDIGFTYAESNLKAEYGRLRLLQSYVLSNRAAGNVALVLHGLKLNGEVYFTLIHTEPLQDPALAQAVCRHLRGLLAEACVAFPEAVR